jgi:hypothetical protein
MIGSEINEQSSLIRLIASREPDRTRSDISVTIASPHEDVGDHVGACWVRLSFPQPSSGAPQSIEILAPTAPFKRRLRWKLAK